MEPMSQICNAIAEFKLRSALEEFTVETWVYWSMYSFHKF